MSRKLQDSDREEEIRQAFNVFDVDSDGFISLEELKKVMISLGENLTTNELNSMIKEADRDMDGKISFQEFVAVHLFYLVLCRAIDQR